MVRIEIAIFRMADHQNSQNRRISSSQRIVSSILFINGTHCRWCYSKIYRWFLRKGSELQWSKFFIINSSLTSMMFSCLNSQSFFLLIGHFFWNVYLSGHKSLCSINPCFLFCAFDCTLGRSVARWEHSNEIRVWIIEKKIYA